MKFLILTLIFACEFTYAALLPSRFVFERVIEQNPKQGFILEQEIAFGEADPFMVKETWQVHGPELKRLTVTDMQNQKVIFSAIYRNKKRMTNQDGQLRTQSFSAEFLQKIFFIQSTTEFAQFAVQLGVVPNNVLAPAQTASKSSQFTYKEEPYVRLARSQGTVTYAYGPVSLSAEERFPGLWIEQDLFQIKKIRFPSKATLTVGSYSNVAPKIFIPKDWSLEWDGKFAKMKIKGSTFKPVDASKLQSIPLEISQFGEISKSQYRTQVEEFYSRFY